MNTLTELSAKFFDLSQPGLSCNDEICFKKSLEQFLKSGRKEDAFVVYFCFSEIFKLFGNGYGNTQKLLETLSDHEYHTGELLTKHRDHYSHSVYVFALGLAVFANDGAYRNAFGKFYGYKNDEESASGFLRLWGMTSLFHDIGYPFELAHQQIKIYAEDIWGKDNPGNPYVSYGNLTAFVSIDEDTGKLLQKTVKSDVPPSSIDELLAYGLKRREGYDFDGVCAKLRNRVEVQPRFMDHAYFSAVILAKQLLSVPEINFDIRMLDVLTAILLHNSFNKYEAPDRHPIKLTEHPLSYLLILCDELQAWDRMAYGKVSKRDPIAWDISLKIKNNEITAKYFFECSTITDENNKKRLNKSFYEIQDGGFTNKIKEFIDSSLSLKAVAEEKKKDKKTYLYASDNNFINLCDFAKAIHVSYLENCKSMDIEHINESFDSLPLEFKVSNIEQAKSYAYKLELINCFYSSKDLDYPVVENFKTFGNDVDGLDNLDFLCREEHVRWVKEKLSLGWKYGTDYTTPQERNAKKIHKDVVPYEMLTEDERKKDEIMINNIIPLLKKFGNNLRIYSYRTGRKPDLEIAGIGHRFFTDDREKIKQQVKSILSKYNENYRVIVRTCFAYGADQLITECANELGIATKASLPTDYENYISVVRKDTESCGHKFTEQDELNMRHLLAQTVVCKVIPDPEFFYLAAGKYCINNCRKLIAIWDGVQTPLYDPNDNGKFINRGGTYHCLELAKQRGLKENSDIHIIRCHRQ